MNRKSVLLLAAALCLLVPVSASASSLLHVIQVTNNKSNDRDPSLNNGQIAWCAWDGHDWEILFWDGHSVSLITDNATGDREPSLDDGKIAWAGWDGEDWEIYLWDGERIIQVTDNNTDDREPSLDRNKIAWRGSDGNDWEIYLWDGFNSVINLSDNDTDDFEPSLSRGKVAWRGRGGGDWDIFYWDGETTINISRNETDDRAPSLCDGRIAWEGRPGDNSEIFYWNGLTAKRITFNSIDDRDPSLHGSKIAWAGFDGIDEEIYLWNGWSTRQITENTRGDSRPSLYDGKIAWFSSFKDYGRYWEICYWDGGITVPVSNDSPLSDKRVLKVNPAGQPWPVWDGDRLFDCLFVPNRSEDEFPEFPDSILLLLQGEVSYSGDCLGAYTLIGTTVDEMAPAAATEFIDMPLQKYPRSGLTLSDVEVVLSPLPSYESRLLKPKEVTLSDVGLAPEYKEPVLNIFDNDIKPISLPYSEPSSFKTEQHPRYTKPAQSSAGQGSSNAKQVGKDTLSIITIETPPETSEDLLAPEIDEQPLDEVFTPGRKKSAPGIFDNDISPTPRRHESSLFKTKQNPQQTKPGRSSAGRGSTIGKHAGNGALSLVTPETFVEGSEDLLAFETDVLAISTSDDVFAIVCCDDYYEYDPYEDIGGACSSGAYEYDPYEDSGVACDSGAVAGGVQNPEPASLAMIAAGVLGVAGLIRRRRAKR